MSDCQVKAGQLYRHFKKGTIYEIVCVATHTEDEADMVVYRDRDTGRCFVRPLTLFLSPKVVDGIPVERFKLLEGEGG
jgi:hypothetical protein